MLRVWFSSDLHNPHPALVVCVLTVALLKAFYC